MKEQLIGIVSSLRIHLLVVLGFVALSLGLFYPILQGKAIYQSDIAQYKGMSHFRDLSRLDGKESYWTQAAFGGMPTYQLGAHYSYNMLRGIDKVIRFLPRPADYVFLYLLGAYLFLVLIGVGYRGAVIGALGFALATYHLIILDVGHNAKAHAIGYFPFVLAALYGLFMGKRKMLFTLALTLFIGLEIYANHYQMTYYLFMAIGLLWLIVGWQRMRAQQIRDFSISTGMFVLALVWAIALNATSLLATREYASFSTRGKSTLTIDPQGNSTQAMDGLSYDYITQYSYGISESLNLLFPRFVGGGNAEPLKEDSALFRFLRANNVPRLSALDFIKNAPLYWGSQPIVAAPAYLGITLVLLAFLGLLYLNRTYRLGFILMGLVFLALSWGKNFSELTSLMIEYVPFYNKFRAVSSIQVILSLLVPLLGAYGVSQYLKDPKKTLLKPLSIGLLVTVVLAFVFGIMSDFTGASDSLYQENYGESFVSALVKDRQDVFYADLIRSVVLGALVLLVLYTQHISRVKRISYVLIGALVVFDLGGVAKRYITPDDFVSQTRVDRPFQASAVDLELQKDGAYFKVFNINEGLNGARTSYFHRSIGGYHAAKPAYIQHFTDYLIYQDHPEVLDILNVKYLITSDQNGEEISVPYPTTLGAAWFVSSLFAAESEQEALLALKEQDYGTEASVLGDLPAQMRYNQSASDFIEVVHAEEGEIEYHYSASEKRFAVFSEWYYTPSPTDWVMEVDGKSIPLYRANYALMGAELPAGEHQVKLSFRPRVIERADLIRLPAQALFLLILLLTPLMRWKKG